MNIMKKFVALTVVSMIFVHKTPATIDLTASKALGGCAVASTVLGGLVHAVADSVYAKAAVEYQSALNKTMSDTDKKHNPFLAQLDPLTEVSWYKAGMVWGWASAFGVASVTFQASESLVKALGILTGSLFALGSISGVIESVRATHTGFVTALGDLDPKHFDSYVTWVQVKHILYGTASVLGTAGFIQYMRGK